MGEACLAILEIFPVRLGPALFRVAERTGSGERDHVNSATA
jgi:hypothetical protein